MTITASTSQLTSEFQSLLPQVATVPVYQYYAKNQDGGFKFFYSVRSDVESGWTYETIPFYAFDKQSPGVVPVYQYHNVYADGSVKYYYSPKGDESNNWKPDVPLPAFYAYEEAQPFTQPVYQYYADDQDGGKKYFYSTDVNAAKDGWKYDFVAFHVAIAQDLNFNLEISNLTIDPSTDTSTIVIELDQPFKLAIDFAGSGNVFENVATQARDFAIQYYAEGYGKDADEVALGSVSGKLIPGQLAYSAPETQLAIARSGDLLKPGVYKIAAVLTISGVAKASIAGLMIQVTPGKCGFDK